MVSSMNFAFGTIIAMLSLVTTVVLRARILKTWPATLPTSTRSPIWIGRSRSRMMPAHEIPRDVLQPEAEPDADRAGEDRQRGKIDAGVLQRDRDADDQDQIADDLRDRVLQRAVEPAAAEEAGEEEALQPRREPKDQRQQEQQPEEHEHAQSEARNARIPLDRNARRLHAREQAGDEDEQAQRGGDERDEVLLQPEPSDQSAHPFAAQAGGEQAGRPATHDGESGDPCGGDVVPGHPPVGSEEPIWNADHGAIASRDEGRRVNPGVGVPPSDAARAFREVYGAAAWQRDLRRAFSSPWPPIPTRPRIRRSPCANSSFNRA